MPTENKEDALRGFSHVRGQQLLGRARARSGSGSQGPSLSPSLRSACTAQTTLEAPDNTRPGLPTAPAKKIRIGDCHLFPSQLLRIPAHYEELSNEAPHTLVACLAITALDDPHEEPSLSILQQVALRPSVPSGLATRPECLSACSSDAGEVPTRNFIPAAHCAQRLSFAACGTAWQSTARSSRPESVTSGTKRVAVSKTSLLLKRDRAVAVI